jgi:pimeloyl-ACP methyl ester carboxylesterase
LGRPLSARSGELGGVRLAFSVSARRHASLVLLHGGSATRVGAQLIDRIDDRWQCWAPDLRGHGDSSHTPGHYALEEVASDIALLIKEVIAAPSVVYGHSFGGHVGLALAAGWPQLVRALVLGDTPLSLETLAPRIERNRRMTSKWRALAASGLDSAEIARQLRDIPDVVSVVGDESPWYEAMAASLTRHDPDFLDSVLERLNTSHRGLRGGAVLKRIHCPVLLIRADPTRGGVVGNTDIRLASESLSDVKVVDLIGVGHELDDVQVAMAINQFLARFVES